MPKVVSFRNNIFTNANRNLNEERFNVFHCKQCVTHCLITDIPLKDIPRRRTDNAFVFDTMKWMVKLNTQPIHEAVKIKRPKGIETQYPHACTTCEKLVGYQSYPHSDPCQFIYLQEEDVTFPQVRKKITWQCTICGYVCRTEELLQKHMVQRGHQKQEEGTFQAPNEEDADEPIPPVIVG